MEKIKLIFSGDFAPIGRVEEVCVKHQHEGFISDIIPIFQDTDLHITNLECPITLSQSVIDKSGPPIKAKPETIQLLRSLNVGLTCMANNHIRDYGTAGVKDTLEECQNNEILTVGAGLDETEARKIRYINIKGKIIAFLNYCEEEFSIAEASAAGANHLDPIHIYDDIIDAKKNAGLVFVVIHGGHEEFPLPSPRIKKIFHFIADLGVSAVIGHHPHVTSGIEYYKGIPLVYSLGNFIFDEPENPFPGWYIGALAEITILPDNQITVELNYLEQLKDHLEIRMLRGEKLETAQKKCIELSEIIKNDTLLYNEWGQFADRYQRGMLKQVLNLNKFERVLFKLGILKSFLIKKNDLIPLLNIIQCEAHRDTLIYSLKKQIKSL